MIAASTPALLITVETSVLFASVPLASMPSESSITGVRYVTAIRDPEGLPSGWTDVGAVVVVGRERAVKGKNAGIAVEFVQIGGVKMEGPCPYRVIVDRISHEVPMYRTYLKQAALQGCSAVACVRRRIARLRPAMV